MHSRPKVFCIGINKTGTTSLGLALQEAGFRVNDVDVAAHFVKAWAQRDFQPIIDFCKTAGAFQDVPFSLPYTYQALDSAFPNSKFILSIRTTPHEWYESLSRFHTDLVGKGRLPSAADLRTFPLMYKGWLWDLQSSVFGVEEHSPYDRDLLLGVYHDHQRQVCDYFKYRGEDLLVLNNAESSARDKLCDFLGVANKWGSQMPHIDSKSLVLNVRAQYPEFYAEEDECTEIGREKAVEVVESYGKLLKSRNSAGGQEVVDVDRLPHPKPVIKKSLITLLNASVDPAEKKVLSEAYVLLADFQRSGAGTVDGAALVTEADKLDSERLGLIEELEQAGFGL